MSITCQNLTFLSSLVFRLVFAKGQHLTLISKYARMNNLVSSNEIVAMSRDDEVHDEVVEDCKQLCGRLVCFYAHKHQYCPNSLLKGYKLIRWEPK